MHPSSLDFQYDLPLTETIDSKTSYSAYFKSQLEYHENGFVRSYEMRNACITPCMGKKLPCPKNGTTKISPLASMLATSSKYAYVKSSTCKDFILFLGIYRTQGGHGNLKPKQRITNFRIHTFSHS